ncbi:MAG: hypothetical protein DRJ55_05510 [Thermoprotei archaeon]|nr:MAG: hypothetical protein DRJ55_05510 [Thermoprotei archaeon]
MKIIGLRKEKAAILIAVILPVFGAAILACPQSPADFYAIEVVLNKPGVGYDLSKLAEMEGIVDVDYGLWTYSAYVYRSHYDDKLVVVVSEQGLKYAVVRVDEEPTVVVRINGLNITLEQLADNIEDVKDKIEWSVEQLRLPEGGGFVFAKSVDDAEVNVFVIEFEDDDEGAVVKVGLLTRNVKVVDDKLAVKIESEVAALLENIGLPQFKKLLKTSLIKGSLAKEAPQQEKYLAVRIQAPLREEVATTTVVHVCNIEYSDKELNVSELAMDKAEELGWNVRIRKISKDCLGFAMTKNVGTARLLVEGKGCGGKVFLFLQVVGVDELDETILSEFEVLKAIGLGEELVSRNSFEKIEETTGFKLVPAFNVSEKDIKEALKVELEWLLEQGVIGGLSEEDIEDIVSASKLGYAGWNSRLVWSDGKWIPYSSMEGAMVLRCVGVPPKFFFPEEEYGLSVPEGRQVTPSPYGKNGLYRAAVYLASSALVAALVAVAAYLYVRKKLPVER